MEKQNKDILDVIEDGIQEAFRRFRIEEAKKEIKKFCTMNFHQCSIRNSNKERFTTICTF